MFWVVPAYNESASVGDLIARIAEVCLSEPFACRVIVVDDGSTDDTADLARAAATAQAPVEVLVNAVNGGLGVALRRGLRAAVESAEPNDVIVTLDADLTQDPSYVGALVAAIDGGADVAIASRFAPGGAVHGVPAFRRLLSAGVRAIVYVTRPIPGVRDYSSGFRAYRAGSLTEAFDRLGERFIVESGFAAQIEIVLALRGHARFAETGFELRYTEKRRSSAIRFGETIAAYLRVLARRQPPW